MFVKAMTVNIKNTPDLPAWQVLKDVLRIFKWHRFVHFVGWQEIGEAADDKAIKRQYTPRRGFTHFFERRATPITVRTRVWSVLDRYWVRCHAGLEKVSPVRGFSVVLARHRLLRWVHVAYVDAHFVSKAWSDPNASRKAWRQENWNVMWEELCQEVATLRAAGYNVIVVGDWNRRKGEINWAELLSKRGFVAASNGYYDHIAVDPADGVQARVEAKDVYEGPLFTDHRPVFAKLELVR